MTTFKPGQKHSILREVKALAKCNNCASVMADPQQEQALERLQQMFPSSTEEERIRFFKARNHNLSSAEGKLQEYLDWRSQHGLDSEENLLARETSTDQQDWEYASRKAMAWQRQQLARIASSSSSSRKVHRPKTARARRPGGGAPPPDRQLPQIVMTYCTTTTTTDGTEPRQMETARDGTLLLHVIPAQVNKKIAASETYALAMALYLDRKFDRRCLGLATIVLDVRPGVGWPNPPAYNMLPFIRATSRLLHRYYPERLAKCILYPMPRAALWIWEAAKPFLEKSIVDAITLIGGSDALQAPPPNDELAQYANPQLLHRMERNRLAKFIYRRRPNRNNNYNNNNTNTPAGSNTNNDGYQN